MDDGGQPVFSASALRAENVLFRPSNVQCPSVRRKLGGRKGEARGARYIA
jgi:hypothetical protein